MKKGFISAILIVFVTLSALFFGLRQAAPDYSFSLLMGANVLMAVLSLIGHAIVMKQVHERPQAFVRGVYASSFLKLMVCMAGILIYVLVNRPNIHKPSLFMLFGIYAIYSVVETWLLSRMAREAK
jgi:Ca2+/Na+ antiporter